MATSIRETIVSWLFSMASSASKKANLAKAAKLKIYDCRLSWTDPKVITSSGKPASVAIGTTVIADSEHRARQMSQERANKEDPVITSAFSSNKVVPPYITDPVGTLAKWQVGPAVDLGDDARDSAAKGMLDAAVVSYAMTPQIV
jgi:hypothetical protein